MYPISPFIIDTFDDLAAKITRRKDRFAVYMKNSRYISDMLAIMGAHAQVLEFENIKIKKALGGNVLASSVSLNYNKSQNSYHREERMSVGSRLHVKGGVEYNGKNLHTVNLNMLNEGDTVYNITGNIIKEAGKSTVKENSDGKSFGLSISHDTFDSAGNSLDRKSVV